MNKTIIFLASFAILVFGFLLQTQTTQAATPHPPGTLISHEGAIWQINETGSKRLPFDSAEKFLSWRYSFSRVVPANAADLSLPEGDTPGWGDGVLFTDKEVIYQVSQGQKHGFTSAEVYLGLGFSFDMPILGDLKNIPEGNAISSELAAHLPGTLLDANGTILVQHEDGAKAFPSAAVFFSHGGTFDNVVPANSKDSIPDNPELVMFRTGSLINDNGAVWVSVGNKKRAFPSVSCFTGFGFSFSAVYEGDSSDLEAGDTICGSTTEQTAETTNAAAYSQQYITANPGQFEVRMATFDLSSGKVRVYTDTASDKDCNIDCATGSLRTFTDNTEAQYGMNGTYFCPASYSSCKWNKNSYFWKVIDSKAGVIVNERSGLGNEDPFLTFDSLGQAKYFSSWNEYKEANFEAFAGMNSPSLIENGQISLDTSKLDESQKTNRSTRGIIAVKGQILYLIQVYGATVPDSANVAKALNVDHALVTDGGGSSALIFDGEYKMGPGRGIPNAITVQLLP